MGDSSSMEKEVRQTSCISQQPQCSKKEEWTISRHQWCCYCLHSSVIAVKKEQERYSVLLYSVVNQQKRISRCAALFQKSHTPVKTQQFKHTSDGTKLIIHNLTKYPFQYSEDTMATLLILSVAKIFNSFSDWNKVIIYGKIVYMCDQELVCQNKLRLVQATFTDVTWLMYARLITSDMLMYSLEVTWSCVHAIRLECNKKIWARNMVAAWKLVKPLHRLSSSAEKNPESVQYAETNLETVQMPDPPPSSSETPHSKFSRHWWCRAYNRPLA